MAQKLYYGVDRFLLRAGSTNLAIDEPGKWNEVLIEVLWDDKFGGYRFEFSDGDILLEFDRASGFDLLYQMWRQDKTNADVLLIYGQLVEGVLNVQYEAKLNFDSYAEDKVKIKMNCERRSFSDKFINYYDTTIDATQTISLGNVNFNPLDKKPLYLHPRLLTQSANLIFDPTYDPVVGDMHNEPLGSHDQQVTRTVVPPFTFRKAQASLDCSTESQPTGANIQGISEPIAPDGLLVETNTFPDGILVRRIRVRARVSFKFDMGSSSGNIYSGIFVYRSTAEADFPMIPLFPSTDNSWLSDYQDNGNVAHSVAAQTYEVDGVIDVHPGDTGIYIKCFVRGASDDFPALDGDSSVIAITNFVFTNTTNHQLTVNEQTVFPPSLTHAYKPFELFNRYLELILDSPNPLKSSLLGRTDIGYDADGCAAFDLTLNGFLVRGFLCKPMNASVKQIFEGIDGIWNTGLSMERDNSGNEFVRFELLSYFFQNVELMVFTEGISDYERVADLDLTFNEVNMGFKKYPDGTRDNQPDSLEDWMTVMNYITPLTKYKKKFDNKIDFILSPYYIEYTRRESFKEKPTESYETDTDIFQISSKLISEVLGVNVDWDEETNTISIHKIVPIIPADIFVISGVDPDIDGTYQAKTVEIPFNYDRVIIVPTIVLTTTGTGNGDVAFDERYQADRNEDFTSTNNVPFPDSVYNLKHHIMRITRRWANFFSSGFSNYYPTRKIKFVSGINNTSVATKLKNTIPCGAKDDTVYDNGPGGAVWDAPLFSGDLIKCTVTMDFTIMNEIRKAFEGRHPDDKNYGYLSIKNPKGVMEHGWARGITFNPSANSCKLILREKFIPS